LNIFFAFFLTTGNFKWIRSGVRSEARKAEISQVELSVDGNPIKIEAPRHLKLVRAVSDFGWSESEESIKASPEARLVLSPLLDFRRLQYIGIANAALAAPLPDAPDRAVADYHFPVKLSCL
jgi:hypothetical protein